MKLFLKAAFSLYLSLAAVCTPGFACAEAKGAMALHQDLSVTLKPKAHELAGRSKITYDGSGKASLWISAAARIEEVSADGRGIPYTFRNGELSFQVPATSSAPAVTVSYRASFNDPVAEHPVSSEDPTYGVSASIGERGTFLGAGAGWYPVPENIPSRRSVTVSAPEGTEAVTSGRRISRENVGGISRSQWQEDHPVGELSLSAGPYRVTESRVGKVALYSYLYPENATLSARYLEAAASYISFYSDLFGPYPFEKFAVVENFFPTGYGLPSYTLLGSSVIRLPFIVHTSFPHEIAHSWWGNGIEPGQDGNWSEGLVTYLADYYLKEKRSAQEARDYRLQLLADYASLVQPERDFPLTRFTGRVDPASRAIGYGKAAMLFHMIRTRIGDRAFFAALRQVTSQHLYGAATWRDFIEAFSGSAGEDLTAFAKQWLVRTGGPHLTLEGVTQQNDAGGRRVKGTVLQSSPPYQLDLPLTVQTEGGEVTAKLRLSGERTPFEIPTTASGRRLLLDPQVELFRVLAPDEVPVTVNSIKGSKRLIGVVTRRCAADRETFSLLMASLDQGNARVVGEESLDQAALRDHDLLICGMPSPEVLPRLPESISLSAESFTVGSARYGAAGDAIFLVTEHPASEGRVAALFLPRSQQAAARCVPKITHYGKYGYLVFSGGENREKGTIAPAAHSTVVDLVAGAPAGGAR